MKNVSRHDRIEGTGKIIVGGMLDMGFFFLGALSWEIYAALILGLGFIIWGIGDLSPRNSLRRHWLSIGGIVLIGVSALLALLTLLEIV